MANTASTFFIPTFSSGHNRQAHIIDTPGASAVVSTTVFIKRVRWVSPSASAGDQAIITDAADRVIWESVAPAANYVEADDVMDIATNGFKVPTLESGKLYIQTE